ncbi:MAG: single-stranded-DNA-specific exonuclease RecJ [Oscillospiraceae bacterium]
MKKWTVNKPNIKLAEEFSRKCNLSRLVLEILTSRGFEDFQSIVDFFNSDELSDPFVLEDMDKAVEAINKAINSYELICIYGDYDCDGVTSTAILYDYLLNIGANVMYYIPQREDGYGLNTNAVEKLAAQGVKLIVTVDNGISAFDEAERIYDLGMRLVITDHHQVSDKLPRAEAVVNPHRPDCVSSFKNLSGAGVAFKLCAALEGGDYEMITEQYSDICSLGTIADIVPLNGENRTIVRKGLMYLKNTENLGLSHLIEKLGIERKNIDSSSAAFQIAPKINAAGRFGSPITALETLLSETDEQADELSEQLIMLNNQRRAAENDIMIEIMDFINRNPVVLNQRVLVIAGYNWHHGVIGIVSSKLLDLFGKPNIVISIDDNGVGRASARSMNGFNIFECFSYAQEYLERFGGHECAGGMTILESNIPGFMDKVFEFADKFEYMPAVEIQADKLIQPEDFTINNIKSLSVLEPFGEGNSQPVFAMAGARVERIFSLSQGRHSKVEVTYGGVTTQVLIFSKAPQELPFAVGDRIDLMVTIEINVFAGKENLSVKAMDYRIHGINQDKYFAAKDCYEKYMRDCPLPLAYLKKMNPNRQELVKIYKTILETNMGSVTFDRLYMKLMSTDMNYGKLKIAIDAFNELGLIKFIPSEQRIVIQSIKERVDINSAEVLVKLRAKIKNGEI